MKKLRLAVFALLAMPIASSAQTPLNVTQTQLKVARAVRVTDGTPHIDGVLDDAAWSAAPVITDFVQKLPREGIDPTVTTEVRLLYDNEALYVAARLRRSDPQAISTAVTRRDAASDAEVFTVSLDPYRDKRTAYSFAITSGGVRGDWYHNQDSEDSGREATYDPVWNARAQVDSTGWTAEMRIPFSQLRYNKGEKQVWGIELTRDVPDRKEKLQWVLIPQAAAGFPSHFGLLEGIERIPPSRRLELLPYVAGDLTYRANVSPLNPFNDHSALRAGGDLKMGLGPNLTLDATVNPDFGQVEADPAVVNLTAFETVFDERRPFFIEGNELITGRGQSFLGRPTWFYSRRVGAPPHSLASAHFVRQPTNTTILSAAKITGRFANRLSIGTLFAATPREFAQLYDTISARVTDVAVEPPSAFGVIRVTKEFGHKQSNAGLTFTQVHRSLDDQGALQDILARDAVAGGADWKLRYKEGMYEVTGWLGGSYVSGNAPALARVQQNSAHYFQRPDQDHVRFDPTRTSLSGYTVSLRGDKNAGRFTLGGIQLQMRSPGFEINDAGQMRSGDDIDFNADIQLRDTKPHKVFRYFRFGTSTQSGWNYGGFRQYTRFNESGQVTFHNFWNLSGRYTYYMRGLADDLTRGGPLMQTGRGWLVNTQLQSRTNAPTTWLVKTEYFADENGAWRSTNTASLSTRPAPRWLASVDPTYERLLDPRQYVSTLTNGPAITFNRRYVFAAVERSTLSARFRVNYSFTPNFTVEGYAEPFAASGRFYDFGELSAPRSRDLRVYGAAGSNTTARTNTNGTTTVTDGSSTFTLPALNFDRLSFRSNLVLRWEWLPGSTAYLIWQQNRQGSTQIGRLIGPRDLWDATTAVGDNFVALKVSYWIGAR